MLVRKECHINYPSTHEWNSASLIATKHLENNYWTLKEIKHKFHIASLSLMERREGQLSE